MKNQKETPHNVNAPKKYNRIPYTRKLKRFEALGLWSKILASRLFSRRASN